MRKILVIRMSSLGDVVLTLPVFRALRQAYPDASVTVMVKESFADVFSGNTEINDRLIVGKKDSIFSLARRVRAGQFDTVVDLHANLRSRIVSWFSGAERVVRYRKAALARRLYVGWRLPSNELQRHTLDRYLEALRRLDPSQPAFLHPTPGAEPAKALIIQTAFLGDAVLTTPLVRSVKEYFPKTSITLLCTPETAEIFRQESALDRVVVYDKRRKDHGLAALWRLIAGLRSEKFDLAIIPHRSFKSALIAWLAGVRRRIGFDKSQGRILLTETVPFQWGVHDVDRNLGFMKALGISEARVSLSMTPDESSARAVAEKLQRQGVGLKDVVLGIHAGSMWATKRWLPERFAEVADRVAREEHAKVIFVGGGKDREMMQSLVGQMKEPALNWVGETNLRELIATIARCDAFLTNDSGPMHIAVACGVPTVAIFGPTTRELGFFPYGPGHQVVEKNLSCRPCGLHGADQCPLGHFHCMRDITSDEVFLAVRTALATDHSKKAVAR